MSWATGEHTEPKEESVRKLKEEMVTRSRIFRTYDVVMEKTYPLIMKKHGSGLDIYLKGEVGKHFLKGKKKSSVLRSLGEAETDISARCSIINNREEAQALVESGYFDIATDDNPLMIIKPKSDDAE